MPPGPQPSARFPAAHPWSRLTWALLLAGLTLGTLLIHGFHPFAEDGGLYAAGVEYALDRSLFPHYTAFVTEHLRFSLFAPAIALFIRLTHLSLAATLLLLDIITAVCTLLSARALLRRCTPDPAAQLAGLALLAAGWTLPIAGTSLYLMDPYVTARSFCMPAALLAIAFALDVWPSPTTTSRLLMHPALGCFACIVFAAAFHPLMAAYALLFVVAIRATASQRLLLSWSLLTGTALLACALLNVLAPADTPAETAAVITRYYWFLSQWHWYERLGLLGPVVMLAIVLFATRFPRAQPTTFAPAGCSPRNTLARAAIFLGVLYTACALLFAHEAARSHMVARLQPLRGFLLLYAAMLLLLGAEGYRTCANAMATAASRDRRTVLRALPMLASVAMAAGMFAAACATYPASPHIEWPWRAAQTPNPWVQAFLWARANTPRDALFALDARYVNTDGEDAQTFRAISLRSALPDYSKDGGEASITPSLATPWLAGADVQASLSTLTDSKRDKRLQPFGVTWMVLQSHAATTHPCPYANTAVKVCRLQP